MAAERNVLGEPLEPCGTEPMTGFHRDGCCRGGSEDGEPALRAALYRRLREEGTPCPPPLTLTQRANHWDWIEDFRGLDGWELFGRLETELPPARDPDRLPRD